MSTVDYSKATLAHPLGLKPGDEIEARSHHGPYTVNGIVHSVRANGIGNGTVYIEPGDRGYMIGYWDFWLLHRPEAVGE